MPQLQSGRFLLLLGLLCLSLFTVLPSSYGLMVSWPWIVLWQAGWLAIALYWLWQLRRFQVPLRLLGHGLDWVVLALVISLVLSTGLGYRLEPSLWYSIMGMSYLLGLYALTGWLSDGGDSCRWGLVRWLGGCAAIASLVSLVLWRIHLPNLQEPVNPFPLGHHNFVAGYLLTALPLLLLLTFQEQGLWRWVWGIGTGLALLSFYTTGSRGGTLGLLSLLAIGLGYAMIRLWQKHQWRFLALSGLGLLAGGALFLSNTRVQRLFLPLLAGQIDGNILFRFFTIEAGIRIWQAHPWFGIGLGNTIKLYDLYRPIAAGPTAFRVQQLHCTPIQILAELGLVGFCICSVGIGLLIWLGWRLSRSSALSPRNFRLVQASAAGLFAYGVSSLTDFQLENIPISLSLIALIALLLSLDQELSPPPTLQQPRLRRYLSLLGLTLVLSSLRFWVPVDLGMMLAQIGMQDLRQGDFPGFYRRWATAADVVPWDPYYPFQLGAKLGQLVNFYNTSLSSTRSSASFQLNQPGDRSEVGTTQQGTLSAARSSLERALKLSPHDELWNRLLGALLVDVDPEAAITPLRHSLQLTPRKPHAYAMLGKAYLNQNDRTAATAAFAIEGLVNPGFLVTDIWFEPENQALWRTVVQQSIQLYDQCLAKLSPGQSFYNALYQNRMILSWWMAETPGQSSGSAQSIELQRLTPIAQALIFLDRGNQQAALDLLNRSDVSFQQRQASNLIKAWIDPNRYLPELQNQKPNPWEKQLQSITQSIQANRQLRLWLLSLQGKTNAVSAQTGFFSYRNTNGFDLVELPRTFPVNLLVGELKLFQEIWILPAFDQVLVEAQRGLLHLDRPTSEQSR